MEGLGYGTKQKAYFGMRMNSGAREGSETSGGRQQEWVSIAMSWDSRFGDLLWKLVQPLDAVGGLDGGDADSARDPIKVDSMLMGFGTGWMNRPH